jgi:hypothetical protein
VTRLISEASFTEYDLATAKQGSRDASKHASAAQAKYFNILAARRVGSTSEQRAAALFRLEMDERRQIVADQNALMRKTGRTSRIILDSPQNSLIVSPSKHHFRHYLSLAEKLNRPDVTPILSEHIIDWQCNADGRHVVIDHVFDEILDRELFCAAKYWNTCAEAKNKRSVEQSGSSSGP